MVTSEVCLLCYYVDSYIGYNLVRCSYFRSKVSLLLLGKLYMSPASKSRILQEKQSMLLLENGGYFERNQCYYEVNVGYYKNKLFCLLLGELRIFSKQADCYSLVSLVYLESSMSVSTGKNK